MTPATYGQRIRNPWEGQFTLRVQKEREIERTLESTKTIRTTMVTIHKTTSAYSTQTVIIGQMSAVITCQSQWKKDSES